MSTYASSVNDRGDGAAVYQLGRVVYAEWEQTEPEPVLVVGFDTGAKVRYTGEAALHVMRLWEGRSLARGYSESGG